MHHIAIDLGGRESQACVRDEQGQILSEGKVPTARLAKYLKGQPPSRVVIETCAEASHVADLAETASHQVHVAPATLVRSLGVGARGVKTDQCDARTLSEVSCRIDLPSVHVPSDLARERRSMCRAREPLVEARTALINSVHGWMRTQTIKSPSGEMVSFPERVLLPELPHDPRSAPHEVCGARRWCSSWCVLKR